MSYRVIFNYQPLIMWARSARLKRCQFFVSFPVKFPNVLTFDKLNRLYVFFFVFCCMFAYTYSFVTLGTASLLFKPIRTIHNGHFTPFCCTSVINRCHFSLSSLLLLSLLFRIRQCVFSTESHQPSTESWHFCQVSLSYIFLVKFNLFSHS